jgi:glycosyltransferase involved in cell wall biosynthesis
LVEKKGFDRLIDALALLPSDLDWHWTHVGGGPMKEDLRARADTQGLGTRITWRGACDQPEVVAEMRRSDLFVLPSRIAADGDRDGLPNVLMEAASQKLPILATPVAAIPEFIETGEHGILVEDTPASLAAAITAFARRADGGKTLADAAHDRLVAEFRMEPGIKRLKDRLTAMLEATR